MNLIKWLEVNSDITLGKLKTEFKKGDVIIIRALLGMAEYEINKFMEQLHKIFPDNTIMYLSDGITLEKLGEKEMNRAGWIRK